MEFSRQEYQPGSWPSPVNRNRLEARQEIQTKLYWGPAAAMGEQQQVTGSLLVTHSLSGW